MAKDLSTDGNDAQCVGTQRLGLRHSSGGFRWETIQFCRATDGN